MSWHTKIFGSKKRKPDWNAIERLMKMQLEANRTNLHGAFANWDWTKGPDGSWTQNYTLDPSLQNAKLRVADRASKGTGLEPYKSPEQFSSMLDASMAHQMARQGSPPGNPQAAGYGPPSADREGRFAQAWTPPPPPPAAAAPAAAPATGIPPGVDIREILARMGQTGGV